MEKFIDEFIKLKEAEGLSAVYIKAYKTTMEQFCTGISKPSDIKESLILNYFYTIQETNCKNSTKATKMRIIKFFCEHLIRTNQLILNTKCLNFRDKRNDSLPKKVWSEREINQLISSLADKRLKAIIELSYSCGLRLKEVIKVDLFDLNLTEQTLLVRESKGKDRFLPVTKKAIEAIQEYLLVRKNIKLKTTALFVTKRGERMKNDNVLRTLASLRVRKKIGKKLTIHIIRHSIATHLLRRGMNIVLISRFLGHSRVSTTNIYTRVVKEDLKKMLDQFHPRDSYEID